ncbi:MAG: hypothetical protein ACJ77K_00900 [Bacteroidia bacterium]
MRRYRNMILMVFLSAIFFAFHGSEGVRHFNTFPHIKYTRIPVVTSNDTLKSVRSYSASLRKIYPEKGLSVKYILADEDEGHITVNIYKGKKRIFRFHPAAYATWWGGTEENIECADIDGNGFKDIKFQMWGGGCGLAGGLSTKIYLMNRGDTAFTCFTFCDFADDYEYDLDGDGSYEILSCVYANYKGHAYWVYNSYNFRNDSLVNNSERFNYPLWTRFLWESSDKIATAVPDKEREKSKMKYPNEFYISAGK